MPKQLRYFEIGRHRLQFLYQMPQAFSCVNRPEHLDRITSEEGFANVVGVELTLLDCARYFHKAGGISAVAQTRSCASGSTLPIIMLSAKGDDIDRIIGLEFGADDYLAKPCDSQLKVRPKKCIKM